MGEQAAVVGRVYAEWAAEQAGKVALDAAYAENDPTQYAETCEALGASDEAQADLLARTRAALAETGTPPERVAKAAAKRRWAALRARFAAALGVDDALALTSSGAWRDQLRIPKGNGDRSGRWTFTPWKHLDDLAGLLGALGADAEPGAREAVLRAVAEMGAFDKDDYDPHDPDLTAAASRVADALEGASASDPSLASALTEAAAGVREFADTDWTLLDEATDIGATDGGRAVKNVWEGDLPGDAAVNPDLADKTSQDLVDELERIKAHPIAPSPTTRRRRAAYLKELQDRRDRDDLGEVAPEQTDIDQPEPAKDLTTQVADLRKEARQVLDDWEAQNGGPVLSSTAEVFDLAERKLLSLEQMDLGSEDWRNTLDDAARDLLQAADYAGTDDDRALGDALESVGKRLQDLVSAEAPEDKPEVPDAPKPPAKVKWSTSRVATQDHRSQWLRRTVTGPGGTYHVDNYLVPGDGYTVASEDQIDTDDRGLVAPVDGIDYPTFRTLGEARKYAEEQAAAAPGEPPAEDEPEGNDPLAAEMELMHKIYRDKVREVPVVNVPPEEARRYAQNQIAALRGQTAEEVQRGFREGDDWLIRLDARLEQAFDAIKDGDKAAYFRALASVQKVAQSSPRHRVGLPEPWIETAKTLLEVEPSWSEHLFRSEDETGPPAWNGLMERLAEPKNLSDLANAFGAVYLKALEDEDRGFLRTGGGVPHQVQEIIRALDTQNEAAFMVQMDALQRTLESRSGLDDGTRKDYWTRLVTEDSLFGAFKSGRRLLKEASEGDARLAEKYGTLPEDQTEPDEVIADIGQFYGVRASNSNCVLASTAYELRRRGLDVHPKQAKKGRNSEQSQKMWFYLAQNPTIVDGLKGRRAKGRYAAIEEHFRNETVYNATEQAEAVAYPPGSRGTIRAGWKNRNFGHIWNWEVGDDGVVRFYDAQTAERIGPDREDYWGEMDWRYVTVQRLDNAPTKAAIEVTLAPPEDVAKVTPDFREYARLLNEIKAKKRDVYTRYAAADQKYWKVPRDSPQKQTAAEERQRLYDAWRLIEDGEYGPLLRDPRREKMKEIGNSFPFLDPSTYS